MTWVTKCSLQTFSEGQQTQNMQSVPTEILEEMEQRYLFKFNNFRMINKF